MKVAVIQVEVAFANKQANIEKIQGLLEGTKEHKPDVIVLPETWNVGFFPINIQELAEPMDDCDSLRLLQNWARLQGVNIVGGSLAIRDGKKIVNRAFVINRLGSVVAVYDKIHLFSPSREDEYFQQGDRLPVFSIDGVPCGLIICYDLRFPELTRKYAVRGAEILFVPAHWPYPRVNHWSLLLQARAIENQMYVVGCNACGRSDRLDFCGHSAVIDPDGEVLRRAGEADECFYVDIDVARVRTVRNQIPVFKDHKQELYNRL